MSSSASTPPPLDSPRARAHRAPAVDSNRREWSSRSAFERSLNRLERARGEALRNGRTLIDLTLSNPTEAGFARFDRAIEALAHPDAHRYSPEPFGMHSAREAAAQWMARQGLQVDAKRIVLTASTSEAYAYLFKLLCDPGDQVLVPAPSYPLLEQLAQLENVRLARYPLAYDGHWHVQLHGIESARDERTRAIVCVHPNNPTGSYLKRDELRALAGLGLPIISDEVFAPYALGPDAERATSALERDDALVFSLHGLSKLAGLPQLKLAFMCIGGPAALADEACARLELIADSFLSPSTPVQLALPEILAAHTPFTEAIRRRAAHNLTTLERLTRGSASNVLRVEGGWYAVLRVPGVLDDEGWALRLLQRADLWVQPGHFYDFEASPPHLVLSLLCPESQFEHGVTRLLECVVSETAARA